MGTYHLLSVGRDPTLLSVRNAVLVSAGYKLTVAYSSQSAVQAVLSGDFDLIIVCHSVPREEVRQMVKEIKARGMAIKILYIRTDGELIPADESIHSLDGPEFLLSCVQSMLSS